MFWITLFLILDAGCSVCSVSPLVIMCRLGRRRWARAHMEIEAFQSLAIITRAPNPMIPPAAQILMLSSILCFTSVLHLTDESVPTLLCIVRRTPRSFV